MFEIIFVSAIVLCAVIAIVILVLVLRSVHTQKLNSVNQMPEDHQEPETKRNNYYETLSDEVELTKVLSAGHQLNNAGIPIRLKNLKTSRSYSLTVCPELIIGRMEIDGVFSINGDSAISKKHCRLFVDNNALWIEDLKSANHTFLNGQTVASPIPVKSGDELQVGNTHLMIFY